MLVCVSCLRWYVLAIYVGVCYLFMLECVSCLYWCVLAVYIGVLAVYIGVG